MFAVCRVQLADAGRQARIGAREVGADHLPVLAAIAGAIHAVGSVIERVGIERREQQGLGAISAHARAAQRQRRHVLHLACRDVVFRYLGAPCAVDDIRVERIGCDIAVLDDAHRMPVTCGDLAIIAPACYAGGTTFLLPAIYIIGK